MYVFELKVYLSEKYPSMFMKVIHSTALQKTWYPEQIGLVSYSNYLKGVLYL